MHSIKPFNEVEAPRLFERGFLSVYAQIWVALNRTLVLEFKLTKEKYGSAVSKKSLLVNNWTRSSRTIIIFPKERTKGYEKHQQKLFSWRWDTEVQFWDPGLASSFLFFVHSKKQSNSKNVTVPVRGWGKVVHVLIPQTLTRYLHSLTTQRSNMYETDQLTPLIIQPFDSLLDVFTNLHG